MKTKNLFLAATFLGCLVLTSLPARGDDADSIVTDASPLSQKAAYLQSDLLRKHWEDGLYVSIVPVAPPGAKVEHTVNQPGNVIHAGVWTGRYLGGVGYQFAVTRDTRVRKLGGEILQALRVLQEVTGKPGLIARGYVKGHGPVEGWERDGADSTHWHQGQGAYADYRWYGDVSVDNFNAVLYGYAIYFDLAADAAQRAFIALDVELMMSHLLADHCRIIDVDGKVTRWGHVGVDPDPSRDDYYREYYKDYLKEKNLESAPWRPALRASLMLLPDLLIAYHITGHHYYIDFYNRVVARFKDNPDVFTDRGPFSLERVAKTDHSEEGQDYEALYNLIRNEHDTGLLARYNGWVGDLWEMNWMEANPLFTWMTFALLPEYWAPHRVGKKGKPRPTLPHGDESWQLALDTLKLYPLDRVLHPVMNSLRPDIEYNKFPTEGRESARVLPMNERPLDNEYAWKGNPYQVDGWLKPSLTKFQVSCDDPLVGWFSDTGGNLSLTLDHGKTWREVATGLLGARVQNVAFSTNRTFVVYAQTDRGVFVTRDGGLSWRAAPENERPAFTAVDFKQWQKAGDSLQFRVGANGQLEKTTDGGKSVSVSMQGWRIPRADSVFVTPWGIIAGGPGGAYQSQDGTTWRELTLWPEMETGGADFLHAYWMGRYYGFITEDQ